MKMQKWEYRQIDANMFFERQMKCGDDGWELVSVCDGRMYFKRLKSPNENHGTDRYTYHLYKDGYVICEQGVRMDSWEVARLLNDIA
jgi:hypothetical protein